MTGAGRAGQCREQGTEEQQEEKKKRKTLCPGTEGPGQRVFSLKTRSAPVVDTGAIIMKKYMCNEIITSRHWQFFRTGHSVSSDCEQTVNSLKMNSFLHKLCRRGLAKFRENDRRDLQGGKNACVILTRNRLGKRNPAGFGRGPEPFGSLFVSDGKIYIGHFSCYNAKRVPDISKFLYPERYYE